MSQIGHGSVAIRPVRRVPESTGDARFQRSIAARTPVMTLLVTQIENCLPGPDRSAIRVYLTELRDLCGDLLSRFPE